MIDDYLYLEKQCVYEIYTMTRKNGRLFPSTKVSISFKPTILLIIFFPSLYAFLSIG